MSLGNLVVNIALQHAEFVKGLDKSALEAQKFRERATKEIATFESQAKASFASFAKNTAGIFAGALGLNALQGNFSAGVAMFDKLDKIAVKTGSSFSELTKQQRALARAGEDFTAAYATSLNKLSVNIGNADKATAKVLQTLGINSKDATGKLRDTAAVSLDVARALQKYEDGAGKAAAVTALYGRAGVELLPILNDLADNYDHVTAAQAGTHAATQQFNDTLDLVGATTSLTGQKLAEGLMPTLNSAGDLFSKLGVNVVAVADFFSRLFVSAIKAAAFNLASLASVIHGTFTGLGEVLSGNLTGFGDGFMRAAKPYHAFMASLLDKAPVIDQITGKFEGQKKSLEGLNLKFNDNEKSVKKAAAAKREVVSEADRFLNALNNEVAAIGKDRFEIKKMEAAKLGLTKIADPLIDKIKREEDAIKLLSDQRSKGNQITQSVRTANEIYGDTQRELNDLLKAGTISQETFNRALAKASGELTKVEEKAADAFPLVEEFAIQASRNIQNAFSSAIRIGLEGDFKGMVASFKSALLAMVAEAAAVDIGRALFGGGVGGGSALGSLFGGFGGGSSSGKSGGGIGGFLSGIGGLFGGAGTSGAARNAFTGASFLGLGGASGSAFASGAGLASSAGGLSGMLASAGPLLGAAGLGAGIGTMLGGNKSVGGLSSGLLSTGGAALGMIGGPIGAAIGGILGGAIAGLFGRGPLKQKETNLIGDFSAGGFSGTTSTKFKAQGGLLVGDKIVRIVADTETGEIISGASTKLQAAATEAGKLAQEVGRFVEGQWLPIVDGFKVVADQMGLAKTAIDQFSFSINIASAKGEALTKEQIGEKISEAADNIARSLIPNIDLLRKGSETAAEAINRLSVQFDELTTLAISRGMSMSDAVALGKNMSAADQQALFDRLGVTGLGSKSASFLSNFGSQSAKDSALQSQIANLISPFGVGLGAVDSKAELFDIYRNLNLNTEDGTKALKVLLDNQDIFLAYAERQEQLLSEQLATTKATRVVSERAAATAREAARAEEERRAEAQQRLNGGLLNGQFNTQDALASRTLDPNFVTKFLNRSFAPGEFNAGGFNFAYSQEVAAASKDAMTFASDNALQIVNVGRLIGQLRNILHGDELRKGFTQDHFNQVPEGTRGVNGLRGAFATLADMTIRDKYQSTAPGIASVFAANDKVQFVSASGFVGGKEQFGADVLAYGNAIAGLNKSLGKGNITLDDYNKTVAYLNDQLRTAKDLQGNIAGQLERINSANKALGNAGVSSIQFYFKNITDSVKEFAAGLSAPATQVVQSGGRLQSLQFVLSKSAAAAVSGFTKSGDLDRVDALTRRGGEVADARLIANAAGIASDVLNTQQGQLIKAKLDQDALFKGAKTKDLALLIDGIKAFDPVSFENAFNNINAALIKKEINEAQFTKLFNTSLDIFEGLSDAAGSSAAALADLRKAARSVADDLLGDPSKNIFTPGQSFQVAEQQFNDTIRRAKAGDVNAAGQLGPMAQALLAAGQNSLSDQTGLIGYVQAQLRGVGSTGATDRLTVDPKVQAQIDAQNKRLDDQSKTNAAILQTLNDMRQTYRDWTNNGLKTTT